MLMSLTRTIVEAGFCNEKNEVIHYNGKDHGEEKV